MEVTRNLNIPTPAKSRGSLNLYVRRKSLKFLDQPEDIDSPAISPANDSELGKTTSPSSDPNINILEKEEIRKVLEENCVESEIPQVKDSELVKTTSPSSDSNLNSSSSSEEQLGEKCCDFVIIKGSDESKTTQVLEKEEIKNSEEVLEENCIEAEIPQVKGKKNLKVTRTKQRSYRPRIKERGKQPNNPAPVRVKTVSNKRKRKDKDSEEKEAVIVSPKTPENLSSLEISKTETPEGKVVRRLPFEQETALSCLELSRITGPIFPTGRKRMARRRRSIWKNKSKRSSRKKNVLNWSTMALPFVPLGTSHKEDNLSAQADVPLEIKDTIVRFDLNVAPKLESPCKSRTIDTNILVPADLPLQIEGILMKTDTSVAPKRSSKKTKEINKKMTDQKDKDSLTSCVTLKRRNKRTDKHIAENLIQQMSYQKEHGLSSLADVPLHIEDSLMRSASYVDLKEPIKRSKDITRLVKEMSRLKLNISSRTTTLIKSGKIKKDAQHAIPKVNLDSETVKEWEILMVNDNPDRSYADEETESKWKAEREVFESRIGLFISRMHLLQGNRKFKQWKGSVVDSVVGVFLTQNVSDYLSSNAFMSVAARYPVDIREGLKDLEYYISEPQEPAHKENNDAKSSEFISTPEAEEQKKTAKRKNEKTGIIEDEEVDWESLRKMHTKEGSRDRMQRDSVDWNAVRSSGEADFATTIRKRGQFRILSERILKFLNNEAKQNGKVDLEWLRYAPTDLVKRYLLEIEGVGLKSTECIRLLGLKHSAFPVDTNVGRIVVRLGWVPLEPLADGIKMHLLHHYPSMDLIQKYLWPRLCKLSQAALYELHYQLITFGKVFCTKLFPNCNACPMKSECKYFASAFVSSQNLLEGSKDKTQESEASKPANSHDDDVNMTPGIVSLEETEEYTFPTCSDIALCCQPTVEFPDSPRPETPELIDIEDFPCRTPCGSPCRTPCGSPCRTPCGSPTRTPSRTPCRSPRRSPCTSPSRSPCTSPSRSPRHSYDAIPEIDIDLIALKKNVVDTLIESGKKSCDEEISKALVVITPENACIPINTPKKMKYYNRLRTEHVVFVLPDNHELLHGFEKRESDDPSPYLLTIWQSGETSNSCNPPIKKCESNGSNLCNIKTCSYCWSIREQNSNTYRGTILIPCRTAMRGGFPLNGTYFQTNEVFADHETSLEPIIFPREWCEGLEKRALYCGSSVTSIFKFLDTRRIQLCFWTGYLCMRGFDRKQRYPKELVRRLHTLPEQRVKKHMKDDE